MCEGFLLLWLTQQTGKLILKEADKNCSFSVVLRQGICSSDWPGTHYVPEDDLKFPCFLETGFLCSFGACPETGTSSYRLACLCLPSAGIKGCVTTTQLTLNFQPLELLVCAITPWFWSWGSNPGLLPTFSSKNCFFNCLNPPHLPLHKYGGGGNRKIKIIWMKIHLTWQ